MRSEVPLWWVLLVELKVNSLQDLMLSWFIAMIAKATPILTKLYNRLVLYTGEEGSYLRCDWLGGYTMVLHHGATPR